MKTTAATVVLDNGAYSLKTGFCEEGQKPWTIPNCLTKAKSERRKVFIGNQIDECRDLSSLYYVLPFQKGYLINWDVQRQVWDHIFGKEVLNLEPSDLSIIFTEPYFNFTSLQEAITEVLLEDFQFKSIYRTNPGALSAYQNYTDYSDSYACSLIVDSGYSFTHIVPYCNGTKVEEGIVRINVGGKVLSNHLKETISYRQLHVMDETYVMNQVKEDICYVSQHFYRDMEIARLRGKENTILKYYVLPDFSEIRRGFIRAENSQKSEGNEQVLKLTNERFAVPEILFHPSDVGIQEMGVPEAVVQAIEKCPSEMHAYLYQNIVLTGGSTMFPGFKDRIYNEVRSMAPDCFDVIVRQPDDPILYPWQGGCTLARADNFEELLVNKEEYEEHGHNICWEKFDV